MIISGYYKQITYDTLWTNVTDGNIEASPSLDKDLDDIVTKLDSVMRRLETMELKRSRNQDYYEDDPDPYPTPIFIHTRTGTPLFTRLFPTMHRQELPIEF